MKVGYRRTDNFEDWVKITETPSGFAFIEHSPKRLHSFNGFFDSFKDAISYFDGNIRWELFDPDRDEAYSMVSLLDQLPPAQRKCKCDFKDIWMKGCGCGGV